MQPPLDIMVAELRDALGSEGQTLGAATPQPPRFELFHGANSICSQKVRSVLAHHAIPHVAHTVNMFTGQTYLPSYVRLRLLGCDRLAVPLASIHSGSTSVSAGGCDAAVVPTLVDWATNEVIVDSKRICLYLDGLGLSFAEAGLARLRPADLAAAIDAEIAIVDNLPNYQMLMGRPPGAAETPMTRNGAAGPKFSMSKVQRCDQYLAEFAGDAPLARAYAAKRAKELHAANQLFSAEAMTTAYAAADAACGTLDDKLRSRGSTWLFGEAVTMADLFWGVELLRMKNLGASTFWEGGRLPQVERLANAAESLPSIRTAVIDWPGALF